MKAYGRNIQTGSFMAQKPLLQRGLRGSYYHPEESGSVAGRPRMNNQTTAMTGLVGVGQRPPLGPLTVIMPAMQVKAARKTNQDSRCA